jgi:metal-responsive CopG/Arc/MetJ family transcriptional regulator
MTARTEKVTISLPSDLVRVTDEIARETRTNRSKVVSSCLREFANRRLRKQLEEGYKAMAESNRHFASEIMELGAEVWPD